MKCPKCGYVGFESVDKCRNCGYHFSLADGPAELDLRLETPPPAAPADLDLRSEDLLPADARQPSAAPRARVSDTPPPADPRPRPDDLPLFARDGADKVADVRPNADAAANAVRRRLAGDTPPARDAAPVPPPGGPHLRPRPDAHYRPAPLALEPDTSADLLASRRRGPATAPRSAGGIARALAGLLDAIILVGLDLGVLYFTLRVCRLSFADIAALPPAPLIGFFVLLDGAYLVAFTANGGQTIGKMATGVRVVGEDGNRVIATQAMIRAAGYLASILPAGLGFVPGFFGPAHRALHDRLASTRVIKA